MPTCGICGGDAPKQPSVTVDGKCELCGLKVVARDSDCRAIGLPLTHEDLGFLLGAHRVSITRAMNSLREAGRIEQRRQQIVLP